jgi:hypothetical protein
MKAVIEGRVYNTKTAEIIHSWDNRFYKSDFHYCEDSLYKTKKGNFFLVGSGGPLSKYSVSCGQNSWGGSDNNVTPLTKEEALRWLEDHDGDSSIIEELFSDMIEEA